jgi:hypothetical protein
MKARGMAYARFLLICALAFGFGSLVYYQSYQKRLAEKGYSSGKPPSGEGINMPADLLAH